MLEAKRESGREGDGWNADIPALEEFDQSLHIQVLCIDVSELKMDERRPEKDFAVLLLLQMDSALRTHSAHAQC
jgi:hypothetical protein